MAKHTKGSQAKARIHFLLGQIYNLKGDKKQAYKSLSKVASLSPPYEVQLNARVLQAEVVSKGKSKAMLSRLNRMAKKAKNIKYSDQIYHAIGNIHLAANDTDKAVAAYEQGVSKSTRSGNATSRGMRHNGSCGRWKKATGRSPLPSACFC